MQAFLKKLADEIKLLAHDFASFFRIDENRFSARSVLNTLEMISFSE